MQDHTRVLTQAVLPEQERCTSLEVVLTALQRQLLEVSAAGAALEEHCSLLDGEAAQLQDHFDAEHQRRLELEVCCLGP
jgi:hypothetical protein